MLFIILAIFPYGGARIWYAIWLTPDTAMRTALSRPANQSTRIRAARTPANHLPSLQFVCEAANCKRFVTLGPLVVGLIGVELAPSCRIRELVACFFLSPFFVITIIMLESCMYNIAKHALVGKTLSNSLGSGLESYNAMDRNAWAVERGVVLDKPPYPANDIGLAPTQSSAPRSEHLLQVGVGLHGLRYNMISSPIHGTVNGECMCRSSCHDPRHRPRPV